jgi:transposase
MQVTTKVAREMTEAARSELEALVRRRDLAPRLRERAEMVKAASQGQDLRQIARWSERGVTTVQYWLRRYRRQGLGGLGDAPRAGRPVRAGAAYQDALEQALAQSPRALGLLFDVWTSARLSAYLAEQTGVRIAPGWLRVLVGRHDFVAGRPKHTLRHLRNADELAACEAELRAVGGKSGGGAGAA